MTIYVIQSTEKSIWFRWSNTKKSIHSDFGFLIFPGESAFGRTFEQWLDAGLGRVEVPAKYLD